MYPQYLVAGLFKWQQKMNLYIRPSDQQGFRKRYESTDRQENEFIHPKTDEIYSECQVKYKDHFALTHFLPSNGKKRKDFPCHRDLVKNIPFKIYENIHENWQM